MKKYLFAPFALLLLATLASANGYGVARVRVMATVGVADCAPPVALVAPVYPPPPVALAAPIYAPPVAAVTVRANVYAPAPPVVAQTTVVKRGGFLGGLFGHRTVFRSRTVIR